MLTVIEYHGLSGLEVCNVEQVDHLGKIRSNIEKCIGRHVRLTTKEGRNTFIVYDGVIESAYKSVFVVKLKENAKSPHTDSRVSFSYTDILTKAVDLKLFKLTS